MLGTSTLATASLGWLFVIMCPWGWLVFPLLAWGGCFCPLSTPGTWVDSCPAQGALYAPALIGVASFAPAPQGALTSVPVLLRASCPAPPLLGAAVFGPAIAGHQDSSAVFLAPTTSAGWISVSHHLAAQDKVSSAPSLLQRCSSSWHLTGVGANFPPC